MAKTRRHVRYRLALAQIAALVAVLAIAPAGASATGGPGLTVMTQNLYLGSSLAPVLEAGSEEEFVEAATKIYATVQYTNFPARAEAVADEIQAKEPDLIGLQEVTKWTTEGLNPPPGYDFLEILEGDLEARGLHYEAAAVSHNANIGPVPLAGSEESCPVLEGGTFTCGVTLEDRDVILVNEDTPGLTWSNPQSGHYETQRVLELVAGSASFDRGWASIDAELNSQPFRFVTTHLETEEDAATQEAQAAEFLAGPGTGETIIATGDFNSAADGSGTASYALLTAPEAFRDNWDEEQLGTGWTCCQESDVIPVVLAPGQLNNPVSTLKTRIDLILNNGRAISGGGEAELIGNTSFQAEPPFWPSDHAGVVAKVTLDDLAVTSSSLPAGKFGTPYSATSAAEGGSAPYTWQASGLPAGLSINPASGQITGTPTAAGTAQVTLSARDSLGVVATSAPIALTIEKVHTAIVAVAAPSSVLPGQPVTLSASLSGASPTGTVSFQEGSGTLGTASVNGAGQASFTTSALAPGSHEVTAVYPGDADNDPVSSVPLSVVVAPLPKTSIRHSPNTPHKPNPRGGPRYTFVFADRSPKVTFYCRLDRRPFKPCHSPRVYRHLKRGRHVFRVKSIDATGNRSRVQVIHFFAGRRHHSRRHRSRHHHSR